MTLKTVFPLAAIVAVGLFSGCDFLDNLGQITFDTELTTNFVVNETTPANLRNYQANQVIDATTDPDIQKYKDRLKDFRVNEVSYKITNYVAPEGIATVTFSNGRLSFGDADANTASVSATLPTLNLRDLNTTRAETRLVLADASALATLLYSGRRGMA